MLLLHLFISLFSAEPTDASVQASLLGDLSSSLSPSQSAFCDGFLSVSECFSALSGMAKRKAPGQDGLPGEFYVKC